jgi:hypothetical protein
MTMSTMRFTAHPMLAAFTPPRTAAEAKAAARRLNGTARASRPVRGGRCRNSNIYRRGPRVDTAAVYAARNRPQDESRPALPAPGPRTFAALAARHYGPPDAGALIPTTPRGAR